MFKDTNKGAHLFISFIIFLVALFTLPMLGIISCIIWLWSVYELCQAIGKSSEKVNDAGN